MSRNDLRQIFGGAGWPASPWLVETYKMKRMIKRGGMIMQLISAIMLIVMLVWLILLFHCTKLRQVRL